jgi:hypothetical protein
VHESRHLKSTVTFTGVQEKELAEHVSRLANLFFLGGGA